MNRATDMRGEAQEAPELADDLLKGAAEIAQFVFGDDGVKARRKIYNLAQKRGTDRLPIFYMGNQMFARRSTLLKSIAEKEAQRS